jgi:conjugal transfer ATP-binding protein TraC
MVKLNIFKRKKDKSEDGVPKPPVNEQQIQAGGVEVKPIPVEDTEGSVPKPPDDTSGQPLKTKPRIDDPVAAMDDLGLSITDVVAPQEVTKDFDYLIINGVYFRSFFISGYPRFVSPGWLEQIINFNSSLDLSFYIYPIEAADVLGDLRHKIAEMEAEIATDLERGKIINPSTQAKMEDARALQEELVKGIEHFFEFGFYVTVKGADLEQLNYVSTQVKSTLKALLATPQDATLDMDSGFNATIPFGFDRLNITRNMDTTSLATTFPLTSAELSSDTGILYGINPQNDSFIIFDRFSLENSNMAVFATSGAGKSYFVKLESVRSLMLGTEVIVIDPENEYKALCEAVGGQYLNFSFSSQSKINPFDLSQVIEEGENQLGLKILSLHAMFKVIMGSISPRQEALLDSAIIESYRAKGITQEPESQTKEPPLIEDLYKTLIGMETDDALDLAARIEKFVKGSFVGIFDQQTNIDLSNKFTVFSVRELEDQLRPIAMFVILDFIWTRVKGNLAKRILVVDEAWHMMRYEDSAQFLWSIVKRARKYYLGLTTITQDVEDFLARDIGKAVVTNSALKVLLKQSPAAIDNIGDVFYLSQGERNLLLGANIGEGIFFAGNNHVPISIVASPEEHELITTSPEDLIRQQGTPKITPTNNPTPPSINKVSEASDSTLNNTS